jgi:predicted nucleotidyltransferase
MLNFKEILTTLKNRNIHFVLIGGQAAVVQGSAYLTKDVDICYSRDKKNLENIVKALSPFHPYLRGAEKGLPFIFDTKTLEMGLNFSFSTDIGDIDLLGEVKGIGTYNEVINYSEVIQIYDMPCNVLTVEGVIKSKKGVARQKDEAIIKEMEAILEIRKQEKRKKIKFTL